MLRFELIPQILSKNEKIEKNKDIIIINSFGDLNDYFKHAKSVFIGKSNISRLKNEGGQNPIDAANLDVKFITVRMFTIFLKFMKYSNKIKFLKSL